MKDMLPAQVGMEWKTFYPDQNDIVEYGGFVDGVCLRTVAVNSARNGETRVVVEFPIGCEIREIARSQT